MLMLAAAAAFAADCSNVDLSDQFPDADNRDQCTIGSCHAFGSIGIVEAAIKRQHGRGVALSEADVFVGRLVTQDDFYMDFRERIENIREGGPAGGNIVDLMEGGSVAEDVRYVLANGAANRDTLTYDTLHDNFSRFKNAELKTLQGQVKQERDFAAKSDALERFFYSMVSEDFQALRLSPKGRSMTERALLGGAGPVRKAQGERAANKRLMEGFLLVRQDFPSYAGSSPVAQDPAQCLAAGKRAVQWIRNQLCNVKPRPVAVSMRLDGLAAWGQTDSSQHASHAFIIKGRRQNPDGTGVFLTRNSWGGSNPDVPEHEACRIFGAATIVAPADKP